MKKNLIAEIILVVGMITAMLYLSCEEEIMQSVTPITVDHAVTVRSGGFLIFYNTSLTMDNRLIQDTVRRHTIFNKNKVAEVSGVETGNGIADVFGTVCRHYNITIKFADSTQTNFEAYANDLGETYTLNLNQCIQVLKPNHPARVVEIERLSTQEKKYNLWLDQIRLLNHVLIKKDGIVVGKYLLDPLEYPQNQFAPKHIH